jgi:hypothetical protein
MPYKQLVDSNFRVRQSCMLPFTRKKQKLIRPKDNEATSAQTLVKNGPYKDRLL